MVHENISFAATFGLHFLVSKMGVDDVYNRYSDYPDQSLVIFICIGYRARKPLIFTSQSAHRYLILENWHLTGILLQAQVYAHFFDD